MSRVDLAPWALFLVVLTCFLSSTLRADERPNLVFLLSDDHRADVLGCAGHPLVRTPNIDGLAAQGIRFSRAFVTTSICAASRATIFTGLFERTHGHTFGTGPITRAHLADSYPAQLRAAGYRTGFVGKFGVRVDGGRATIDTLFDVYVPLGRRNVESGGEVRHFTDVVGDRAIEFIRRSPAERPFCLSVSFNAAHASDGDRERHYPYPPTEATLYEGLEMPRPKLDGGADFDAQPEFLRESMNRDRYFWRWDTPEKYQHNLRNYFRMLSGMDRNIGRIIRELRDRGLAESTVVIFMGDNGYYMGERGFAGKWSHYDESLRVPLVIHDPRRGEKGGIVNASVALNLDIAPTLLQLAEVPRPQRYQGVSLLSPTESPEREGFFCEHRMDHERIPKWEGFRGQRYVYANYYLEEASREFLHDLEKDPDQRANLAKDPEHGPILRQLRRQTRELSRRYFEEGRPDPKGLPRVLVLGDSISMGYHQSVVEGLKLEAVVVRPRENCAGTTHGLARIDQWLALEGGDFDLIHFNFGLHDLKAVAEPGSSKGTNNPDDPRQADLETYERQLRQIVEKLVATGAHLIFATTTPYPEGVKPHRDPRDVARYNTAALKVMKEKGIAVNDLHGFASSRLEEIQQPANVHFTRKGSRRLGELVVKQVRRGLKLAEAGK